MVDLLEGELAELEQEQIERDFPPDDPHYLATIRDMASDAEQWIKNDISDDRERAHRYYQGNSDLNAQEDRSRFVMRTVRDVIEMMVPKQMEIFTGAEHVVSFKCDDIDEQMQSACEDMTATFHKVFWKQNDGWELLEDFIRSALKSKQGTFKVYRKDEIQIREHEFRGPLVQFEALAAQDNVEVIEYREDQLSAVQVDPMGNQYAVEQTMVDATVVTKTSVPRVCIEVKPPEEMLINRAATRTKYGYYTMIGEKSIKTVSDAIEMGVPEELALRHASSGNESATGDYQDQERRERRQLSRDPYQEAVSGGKATRPITIYEMYARIDKDEDGFAELRRIVGIGEGPAKIVEDTIVDDHPYAESPAIAIENSVIGESLADNVMDLQDLDTQLMRGLLNNIGHVNNPRPIVNSDTADMDTVLDNRYGAPIEATPGSIDWHVWPDITPSIISARQQVDEIRGERTGMSRDSMGLDAAALQSSSEVGVLAILGAGMTQPKMIAATIAHRAFVPLAQKTVKLLRENPDIKVKVLSQGNYAEVDASQWPADDLYCDVAVGLGTGTREERIQALMMVRAEQKEILLTLGPDNPLVNLQQYAYTLHLLTQLTGAGASTSFFNSPEEVLQRVQQAQAEAAQQPPEPSDEEKKIMAQEETKRLKIQSDRQTDLEEAQIKAMTDRDIEMQKLQLQETLRLLELAMEERLEERAIAAGSKVQPNLSRN